MAGRTLRFSADEAADVLRGSKVSLLKATEGADYLRTLDISEGTALCGETDEGGAFCELTATSFFKGPLSSLPQDVIIDEEMKKRGLGEGAEVVFIKFEVAKVLSSVAVDSKQFWGAMAAADIPTKTTLHSSFMDIISSVWAQENGGSVLDMGCGDGRIALQLLAAAKEAGGRLDVVGVDVCAEAVAAASAAAQQQQGCLPWPGAPDPPPPGGASRCAFVAADTTSLRLSPLLRPLTPEPPPKAEAEREPKRRKQEEEEEEEEEEKEEQGGGGASGSESGSLLLADSVLCQLVLSVVGPLPLRQALIAAAFRHLKPGGWLALSASGASETVNDKYKALYEQDEAVTGEYRTYLSRGDKGEVLYVTHHLTPDELRSLLQNAGFSSVTVKEEEEASSRRPDQKAIFLYATAQRPH